MGEQETYLGDGLYVAIELDMVRLRAPRVDTAGEVDHVVYLEPPVLQNFLDWLKREKIIIMK
jgi:hypothetical protein